MEHNVCYEAGFIPVSTARLFMRCIQLFVASTTAFVIFNLTVLRILIGALLLSCRFLQFPVSGHVKPSQKRLPVFLSRSHVCVVPQCIGNLIHLLYSRREQMHPHYRQNVIPLRAPIVGTIVITQKAQNGLSSADFLSQMPSVRLRYFSRRTLSGALLKSCDT